jgi:hypothetical protein
MEVEAMGCYPMEQNLWVLLYRSAETYEMHADDLLKLLLDAREHNLEHGITGLLLYHEGRFMQMLEGPRDAVLPLYERIAADPRHCDTVLEFSEGATQRLFPDWQMGFAVVPNIRGRAVMSGIESDREAEAVLRTLAPDRPLVRRMLGFLTGGSFSDPVLA